MTVQERYDAGERLTEKSVGCFKYSLKDHVAKVGEYGTYDAFYDNSIAIMRLGELEDKLEKIEQIINDPLVKAFGSIGINKIREILGEEDKPCQMQ